MPTTPDESEATPFVTEYLDAVQRDIGTEKGSPSLRLHLERVPEHLRAEVKRRIRASMENWETWAAPGLCY